MPTPRINSNLNANQASSWQTPPSQGHDFQSKGIRDMISPQEQGHPYSIKQKTDDLDYQWL